MDCLGDENCRSASKNNLCKIKKALIKALFTRGIERIRTAVAAFAELSLASRPQYLLEWCKYTLYYN